jgi:hypothetical protein
LDSELTPIEQIARARIDFAYFCKTFITDPKTGEPLIIKPYQMEWINLSEQYRKLILFAPRQLGKTYILGICKTLWKSVFNEGYETVIASQNMKNSSNNLFKIRTIMLDNKLISGFVNWNDRNARVNASEILLKNKADIKCLVWGPGARGHPADYILLDEISTFGDQEELSTFIPMMERRMGHLTAITTPQNELDLGCVLTRNKHFFFKRYPVLTKLPAGINEYSEIDKVLEAYDKDPTGFKSIDEDVFTVRHLLEMWESDPQMFLREYMCIPVSLKTALFDPNWISKSQFLGQHLDFERTYDTISRYVIGCMVSGSFINTNNGMKKIETISENDKLLTHVGKFENIKNISRRRYIDTIIRIKPFYQPLFIETTKEHPYLIYDNGLFKWKRADEISIKDKLTIPITKISNLYDVGDDTAYIIGLWLADGWKSQGRICICFGLDEETNKLEGILLKKNIKYYKRNRRTSIEISFLNKEISSLLKNFAIIKEVVFG